MIISHNNKFIWIKSRKTASSSIEIALNKICDYNDYINILKENWQTQKNYVNLNNQYKLRDFDILPHEPIYSLKQKSIKYDILNETQWNEYYKFTVERNPWTKVISLYYYFKDSKWDNYNTPRQFMNTDLWKICYNWPLYTMDDKILVDHIMRYEHINYEINQLSNKLGKVLNLEKENIKIDKKLSIYNFYSINTLNKVKDYFRKEIDYMQYEFK